MVDQGDQLEAEQASHHSSTEGGPSTSEDKPGKIDPKHEKEELPNIKVTSPDVKAERGASTKNIPAGDSADNNDDADHTEDPDTSTETASPDAPETVAPEANPPSSESIKGDAQPQAETEQTETAKTESSSHVGHEESVEPAKSIQDDQERDEELEDETKETDDVSIPKDTVDFEEAADVLGEQLPAKSIMLKPIPEPDFSDLADREKLFPRPAISNPKVTYELACKQLGVVPISQYLRSLDTYAEDLRLQRYGLARLDMLPLCHSLAYNTTATSLNLSQNRLEDDVLPNIQSMMNDNSFIGSIDLSRNNLTGPGLDSLQVMLSSNYTLTSIDLSHCHLLDSDAPALAAVIEISLNLRTLGLGHNELSECGKVLGTVLAVDEGLETLDLSWNMFRSKSAKELLLGLRKNSRLRRLDLAWNSLGPDTAVGLRDLLKKNGTIAELDVSHNRLSDNNMRPIGLGLTKNHSLEKIWIGHNPVTPVGALALMKALPKATTNYVDMSQIEVSSDFVKLKEKLDPEAITVVHGTVNKDMVLLVPVQKKGKGPPAPAKKKK